MRYEATQHQLAFQAACFSDWLVCALSAGSGGLFPGEQAVLRYQSNCIVLVRHRSGRRPVYPTLPRDLTLDGRPFTPELHSQSPIRLATLYADMLFLYT